MKTSGSLKRFFDVIMALLILVVLAPVLMAVACLVILMMGRPVFFRQKRPGFRGEPFTIYKFRTMTEARGGGGNLLADGERLTPLGRFLRRTSLDELPELYNVLKGEMSVVGPRPLLMQYMERYTPKQARRHEVRPGITGLAQAKGRNVISWDEKFEMDVWYVDNRSFMLDLKVIALTVSTILKCEGINQPGHATAEEFKGGSN